MVLNKPNRPNRPNRPNVPESRFSVLRNAVKELNDSEEWSAELWQKVVNAAGIEEE